MDPEVTAIQAAPGQAAEPEASERKFIQFPTDKLREINRLATIGRETERSQRSSTLPTQSADLDQNTRAAVDLITTESARATRNELADDFSDLRDVKERFERQDFDQRLAQMEKADYAPYIRDSIANELERLQREHPKTGSVKLLNMAEDAALLKAVKSGAYKSEEAVKESERERLATRTTMASSKGGAAGDRTGITSASEMSAEQLAGDQEALASRFRERFGRDRR